MVYSDCTSGEESIGRGKAREIRSSKKLPSHLQGNTIIPHVTTLEKNIEARDLEFCRYVSTVFSVKTSCVTRLLIASLTDYHQETERLKSSGDVRHLSVSKNKRETSKALKVLPNHLFFAVSVPHRTLTGNGRGSHHKERHKKEIRDNGR